MMEENNDTLLNEKDRDKIGDYLKFKEECVNRGLFNINEIILLWEVIIKNA